MRELKALDRRDCNMSRELEALDQLDGRIPARRADESPAGLPIWTTAGRPQGHVAADGLCFGACCPPLR